MSSREREGIHRGSGNLSGPCYRSIEGAYHFIRRIDQIRVLLLNLSYRTTVKGLKIAVRRQRHGDWRVRDGVGRRVRLAARYCRT
ncbi:hypothetical protein Hanom_Chr07g00627551 [Helianthus anomalus]